MPSLRAVQLRRRFRSVERAIVLVERICEGTLLRGLLVHSAGDYHSAHEIIGWSPTTFVRVMNKDARALGPHAERTTVDLTACPADQSTAEDQATLAVDLMTDEPTWRQLSP